MIGDIALSVYRHPIYLHKLYFVNYNKSFTDNTTNLICVFINVFPQFISCCNTGKESKAYFIF